MQKWLSKLRISLLRFLEIHPACILNEDLFYENIAQQLMYVPRFFGDRSRVHVGQDVVLNDALINTSSGQVTLEDYAFCGHGVCLLTGTHDYQRFKRERQLAVPEAGRDILVCTGAWLGSNVTIIGPCTIGEHAVVAAGSLVLEDVPPHSVYGGVPARPIKIINPDHA